LGGGGKRRGPITAYRGREEPIKPFILLEKKESLLSEKKRGGGRRTIVLRSFSSPPKPTWVFLRGKKLDRVLAGARGQKKKEKIRALL